LLLLNFGIKSKIYNRSRPPRRQFSYTTKSGEKRISKIIDLRSKSTICETNGMLFEVHLHGKNISRFNSQIGFLCNKNKGKIEQILSKNLREDTFCI